MFWALSVGPGVWASCIETWASGEYICALGALVWACLFGWELGRVRTHLLLGFGGAKGLRVLMGC